MSFIVDFRRSLNFVSWKGEFLFGFSFDFRQWTRTICRLSFWAEADTRIMSRFFCFFSILHFCFTFLEADVYLKNAVTILVFLSAVLRVCRLLVFVNYLCWNSHWTLLRFSFPALRIRGSI